jgi:hypothetical protein
MIATFYEQNTIIGRVRTVDGKVVFEDLPASLVEELLERGVIGRDADKKLRRLRVEDGDWFLRALPLNFKTIYLWARIEEDKS